MSIEEIEDSGKFVGTDVLKVLLELLSDELLLKASRRQFKHYSWQLKRLADAELKAREQK